MKAIAHYNNLPVILVQILIGRVGIAHTTTQSPKIIFYPESKCKLL